MKSILREQRLNSILVALVTMALGFVLVLWPNDSVSVMCYILGGALLLSGLLYMAGWFGRNGKEGSSALLLIPGVVLAGLGVWIMLSSESVITLIQYVFGAVLIFHGFLDLQGAVALVSYKAGKWWFDCLLGLGTLALGIIIIVNPFGSFSALVTIIGMALVYDGFTDLWLILRLTLASRAFRKAQEEKQREDEAEKLPEADSTETPAEPEDEKAPEQPESKENDT